MSNDEACLEIWKELTGITDAQLACDHEWDSEDVDITDTCRLCNVHESLLPESDEYAHFESGFNKGFDHLAPKVIEVLELWLEHDRCGETSCPLPMRAMCSSPIHKMAREILTAIKGDT